MRPTIVCDIDGTLGDWVGAAARVFGEYGAGYDDARFVCASSWSGWEEVALRCGVTASEFWERFFSDDVLLSMTPFEGVASALNELWCDGWDIRYFTARAPHCRAAAITWLMENRFPCAGWTACGHDRLEFAESVLASQTPVVLLDDRPDTLMEASERSIPLVAVRHPYNLDVIDSLELPYVEPEGMGILPLVIGMDVYREDN